MTELPKYKLKMTLFYLNAAMMYWLILQWYVYVVSYYNIQVWVFIKYSVKYKTFINRPQFSTILFFFSFKRFAVLTTLTMSKKIYHSSLFQISLIYLTDNSNKWNQDFIAINNLVWFFFSLVPIYLLYFRSKKYLPILNQKL